MKQNKKKGFTLIELLAVIAISGFIFGVTGTFVYTIISNSKNKSIVLAENSIKKTASMYVEEYSDDVLWTQNADNGETSYTCIEINSLVSKGYLKEKDIAEEYKNKFVSLTKDKAGNIIDMYFSNDKKCDTNGKSKVSIPTAKKYCNDLSYNGSSQVLIKDSNIGFTFLENNTGIETGNYVIEAKLNDGYIWMDNTQENKKITCSIKKATPTLLLSSYGEIGNNLNDTSITLTSNVAGSVTLKTSNSNVASAIINSKEIQANNPSLITIKKYATKNNNTYITMTFTPNDTKNYTTTTAIYTIGNVKKKTVNKPSCINPYYNGTSQELVKNNTGYVLINNEAQEIKDNYKVIARLAYGYVWNDNTSNDYELTCAIKRPTPTVTYNNNGGSGCSSTKVTYGNTYGNLCTPTRDGYNFLGWYTSSDGGSKIEANTTVTNFKNHILYAQWQVKYYIVDVNPVINGTTYNSGLSGFTFKVYLNGNLVANNVIDYYNENVAYGTQVRVVPDGVVGYSSSEVSTGVYGVTSLSGPTWSVNSYVLDVNPVINGTTYYSGLSGFTFKVYLNGNLDTVYGNDVLDYYQYVPYGTQVRVVPNWAGDYTTSEASTTIGAFTNSLNGPTWTGNWYSFTATFNYVIDTNHNFSLVGNSATITRTCSYQIPANSCVVDVPGVVFPSSTTGSKSSMSLLFNVTWNGSASSQFTITGNSTFNLGVSSKYPNSNGTVKGGDANAWVRDDNVLTKAMADNQKYGYVLKDSNVYWKDGDYRIGTVNHLIWIKGHTTNGVRCKNFGHADAAHCDNKACEGNNCNVPNSGNAWISLRSLKW